MVREFNPAQDLGGRGVVVMRHGFGFLRRLTLSPLGGCLRLLELLLGLLELRADLVKLGVGPGEPRVGLVELGFQPRRPSLARSALLRDLGGLVGTLHLIAGEAPHGAVDRFLPHGGQP